MLNMTLGQIRDLAGGILFGQDARVDRVVTDSRESGAGCLFVALKGEKVDGHDFLPQVLQQGAVAALVERRVDCALPQVVVPSCMKAMAALARAHRQQFRGTVFGITGSSGKTSTKEMLSGILAVAGQVMATKGNYNNEIGVPLTVFNIEAGHDFAIIEMGAAQKGDIAYLMDIACPDVTAITNVGSAHVGRFGSEAVIASTKAEIYTGLKAGGKAVVNTDMQYAAGWLELLHGHPVKTFSIDGPADVYATAIVLGVEGSSFTLHHEGKSVDIRLAAPGKHNIANALCAAACALHAQIPLLQIKQGLSAFVPVASRLQNLAGAWGGILIDDCYNANPGSVRAAIDVLANYSGNKVLVLGDMAELGQASQAAHAGVGEYARSKGIDRLFTCGTDSAEAGRMFGVNARHFPDKKTMIAYLQSHLGCNDVVLVKGSRSAALEEVVQSIKAKVAN